MDGELVSGPPIPGICVPHGEWFTALSTALELVPLDKAFRMLLYRPFLNVSIVA
jgi:hypothetical protein